MADVEKGLVSKSYLTATANAIRSKLGTTATYKPSDFATAIGSISGSTDTSFRVQINNSDAEHQTVVCSPHVISTPTVENGVIKIEPSMFSVDFSVSAVSGYTPGNHSAESHTFKAWGDTATFSVGVATPAAEAQKITAIEINKTTNIAGATFSGYGSSSDGGITKFTLVAPPTEPMVDFLTIKICLYTGSKVYGYDTKNEDIDRLNFIFSDKVYDNIDDLLKHGYAVITPNREYYDTARKTLYIKGDLHFNSYDFISSYNSGNTTYLYIVIN